VTAPPPTRSCPMCGGRGALPRASIDRDGHRFSIDRCISCGFVFVTNPGGTTFDHEQVAPLAVPEKPRHRQIKRICDIVVARRGPAGAVHRVVEVGAGWGGLAQVFARDSAWRYAGFEPSAARAAFCRARGFDVRAGLFDASGAAGVADAIVFDNVLEHVNEPRSLVRDAVASLRAGGVLIVIVPNRHDLRRFHPAWRDRHYWQPHCHINYFASHDLDRLFRAHGMKLRFFGFEAVGGLSDDAELLPRVLADRVGLHLLGLNTYGVKPGAS
jgi:SAM-dependent methyltransferase